MGKNYRTEWDVKQEIHVEVFCVNCESPLDCEFEKDGNGMVMSVQRCDCVINKPKCPKCQRRVNVFGSKGGWFCQSLGCRHFMRPDTFEVCTATDLLAYTEAVAND